MKKGLQALTILTITVFYYGKTNRGSDQIKITVREHSYKIKYKICRYLQLGKLHMVFK